MEAQNLLLVLVKNMCCEAPVGSERLPRHSIAHTEITLCNVADMVASWIHDNVAIGLFESNHNVHHLNLPGDNER